MTSKNTAYILSNMNSVLYNRYGMRGMRRLTYDTSAVAKIAYFSHLYFYQPLLLFVVASLGYFKNIIILCILCKQCYTIMFAKPKITFLDLELIEWYNVIS